MYLRTSQFIQNFTLLSFLLITGLVLTPVQSFGADSYPDFISTMQFGHGTRLTTTEGMTLYQFQNDLREPGASTCNGDCAVGHPPFLATNIPDPLPENWSIIERDDGAKQWTYKNMPVYTSKLDSHVGADYGQGQGWDVAFETMTMPAEFSIANTTIGHVLASAEGQSLYVQSSEVGSEGETCTGTCLETWLPVQAPWAAASFGDFSVHTRTDGMTQWAYQNKPLYAYASDAERGDLNGNGADGVWTAMLLEPTPPKPDWVNVVGSDGGPLYANSDGMTLYTLYEDRNSQIQTYLGGNACDEACLEKYWTAVIAPSPVTPVGQWSVVDREGTGLQWTYMGRPLYTLDLETRPGQLFYTTFRQFQWMKPIMYELPALQGVF